MRGEQYVTSYAKLSIETIPIPLFGPQVYVILNDGDHQYVMASDTARRLATEILEALDGSN